MWIQIDRQIDMPSKTECSPGQTTATDYYSPTTDNYADTD